MTTVDLDRSPVHWQAGDRATWTTVNTAEALPGVLTPLAWGFWEDAIELGMRECFYDLGVLSRREIRTPAEADERFSVVFYGRYAANITMMRMIGDRMLGTDGDAVEEQILGSVDSGIAPQPQPGRYPVVAVKMPLLALRLPRRLARLRVETSAWWRTNTSAEVRADGEGAPQRFAEASRRFQVVMRPHAAATMLAQAAYDQVRLVAEAAGRPGLERRLVTGYGDFEEARVTADLWAVSRRTLSLQEFVARHGYHGPNEGSISSRSWREDQAPLRALVETYRTMPDEDDPLRSEPQRAAERSRAEQELLAALPRLKRVKARAVLGFARRHIPVREVGKAAFLQAIDVGRAAARSYGVHLAERDLLDDPEDVFYLARDEMEGRATDGLRELVAQRRREREALEALRLPDTWTGAPEPVVLAEAAERSDELSGIPVSAGTVEGRARVVTDADAGIEIEPGEVLVCETTDPSWASYFLVASALVIDIGGAMSHGAIVARELGVPCVINTRDGTRQLSTGDLLRVDGDAGEVAVVERASAAAAR